MAMWSTCLRFVTPKGITARELERLAGTGTNLSGMERWGYVCVQPDPADPRQKPPRSEWLITPTAGGRMMQRILPPIFGTIEKRWEDRFGKKPLDEVRASLEELIAKFEVELPETLPILRYGLSTSVHKRDRRMAEPASSTFAALLSQVLLAFALEFEQESEVSLAICANVVRLTSCDAPVRVRDLPRLSGVSKEAIATALSFMEKRGYAMVEAESPGNRAKAVRLTAKGQQSREAYNRLVWSIEEGWRDKFGSETITKLRQTVEQIVSDPEDASSALFKGMRPYSDGWRATVPKPERLPHYPMILHRGGYPDGS